MTPPTVTADPPIAAPAAEKPVFAATGDARPRALKLAGRLAAGLVGLWLVALVLGALGFGHVPGLQLPRIGGDDKVSSAARDARRDPAATSTPSHAVKITARHSARLTPGTRAGGPSSGSRGAVRRDSRTGSVRGGTTGGSGTSTGTGTGTGSSFAATPSPASTTPAPAQATTTPTSSHSNSTHSQSTPPGSSSTDPGSRSQATTAPGREESTATPAPGSGSVEHKPPKE